MLEHTWWLQRYDDETLEKMQCAIKAFEAEFGVALLVFGDVKDRDHVARDIAFARKVKSVMLALVTPQQGGQ